MRGRRVYIFIIIYILSFYLRATIRSTRTAHLHRNKRHYTRKKIYLNKKYAARCQNNFEFFPSPTHFFGFLFLYDIFHIIACRQPRCYFYIYFFPCRKIIFFFLCKTWRCLLKHRVMAMSFITSNTNSI